VISASDSVSQSSKHSASKSGVESSTATGWNSAFGGEAAGPAHAVGGDAFASVHAVDAVERAGETGDKGAFTADGGEAPESAPSDRWTGAGVRSG
jgi:hypothetical protein